MLNESNFFGLNQLLRDRFRGDGIRGYCYDCDRVYCRKHMIEDFSTDNGGFIDRNYGICPYGHVRDYSDFSIKGKYYRELF